jgi:nitrite reductase (NO-forming)
MKQQLLLVFTIFSAGFLLLAFTSVEKKMTPDPLTESIKRGKLVYEANCISCHMAQGEGIPGVFPPLAKSDYLMADKARAIKNVIFGLKGKITVNGQAYDGEMPKNDLPDQQVMDVLNYIRNSWGNKGAIITINDVKANRKK